MLELTISSEEKWDEETERFIKPVPKCKIQLEHSLISMSKWEMKWHKPFLETEKTREENISYIECMVLNKNFDMNLLLLLSDKDCDRIGEYIKDPMTATVIPKRNTNTGVKKIYTNELIYYYMSIYSIPVEFQKWHLNRLLTLIKLCDYESQPPEELSQREIMERNKRLNAERRAKYNSKG